VLTVPLPRTGTLICRDRSLSFGRRTLVMGIINLTPDSFSGDGLAGSVERAVDLARAMVADGADLLDIGGESTRPDATRISVEEEIRRVVSPIQEIARAVDVPLSIDTRRAAVAEAALTAGAHLVNDVDGLQRDPRMAPTIAAFGAAAIAMHSPGPSWEVPWPATFGDVVAEISSFLNASIQLAVGVGIPMDRIVIDPGFGFGKNLDDNLTILRRLGEFRELGQPVLIGTSRKSTIGRILGADRDNRLEGSLATVALAVAAGVDIVRVHDVRASARAARVADAIVRAGEDANPG
jgi:dihydropteroate synthase